MGNHITISGSRKGVVCDVVMAGLSAEKAAETLVKEESEIRNPNWT